MWWSTLKACCVVEVDVEEDGLIWVPEGLVAKDDGDVGVPDELVGIDAELPSSIVLEVVERDVSDSKKLVVMIGKVLDDDWKDVLDTNGLVLDFVEHTMDKYSGCITALS